MFVCVGFCGCISTTVGTNRVTECASSVCVAVGVCVRNVNLLVNVKKLAV